MFLICTVVQVIILAAWLYAPPQKRNSDTTTVYWLPIGKVSSPIFCTLYLVAEPIEPSQLFRFSSMPVLERDQGE